MGRAIDAPEGATWQNRGMTRTPHIPLIGALLLSLSGCVHSSPPALYNDLWDYDAPADTEARFQKLLPDAPREGVDTDLQLRTQIARAQGLQGRFEEAYSTLRTVAQRLSPAPSTAHVRWFLEHGRVTNSRGDGAAARPDFEAAWQLAQALALDGLAVDAAHMIAIAAPQEAPLWNQRALDLAEGSKDPDAQRWLGSLHNNMGWALHEAGKHEDAQRHFEAALAARLELGNETSVFVARWAVARGLRALGRLEEALAAQEGLAADRDAADVPEDGYVSEELGELLLALGREQEATEHFARAADLLGDDPWFAEHEAARLERLRDLGSREGASD